MLNENLNLIPKALNKSLILEFYAILNYLSSAVILSHAHYFLLKITFDNADSISFIP